MLYPLFRATSLGLPLAVVGDVPAVAGPAVRHLGSSSEGRSLARLAKCCVALTQLALGARRVPKVTAVALREMRRRLKSAGCGDIHDRHCRLQQQLPCAAQAHFEVVTFRYAVQIPLEQALDLAARQARRLGNFLERQRLLDILLHELRDSNQPTMRYANLRPQRNVLAIRVVADSIDDKLLGDQ